MSKYPALTEALLNDLYSLGADDSEWLTGSIKYLLDPAVEPEPQNDMEFSPLIYGGMAAVQKAQFAVVKELINRAGEICQATKDDQLFNSLGDYNISDQRQITAYEKFTAQKLYLVTGGPGTGKTTIAAALIEKFTLLTDAQPNEILVAAPTGRAAGRMNDSLQEAFSNANKQDKFHFQAQTIHRLLGFMANKGSFKYNRENHLNARLVVLDEASMVSGFLLSALIQALPEYCTLLLLGDPNQLPPVDADDIFTKISSGIDDRNHGQLVTNFRAKQAPNLIDILNKIRDLTREQETTLLSSIDSLVGRNCHDIPEAIDFLKKEDDEGVMYMAVSEKSLLENLLNDYRKLILEPHYLDLANKLAKSQAGPGNQGIQSDIWQLAAKYQILAMYKGAASTSLLGTFGLNQFLEASYQTKRFPLRPKMQTKNNYQLGIYNGDVGLLYSDKTESILFPPGQQQKPGEFKIIPPGLPGIESAYAITVHKSQGSQYENILLVLPADVEQVDSIDSNAKEVQLNTLRKLIYTAVSRARKRVLIVQYNPGNKSGLSKV